MVSAKDAPRAGDEGEAGRVLHGLGATVGDVTDEFSAPPRS